ncbi:uncharacterized protein LOC131929916 [Physella acuta]|uniref:uncharacterized protein LOC131929916 n=1 Tax=Physella acuta TaxID=109671 RepID=UPI0027DE6A3B|nr:uncharacterized protein LOC131929916 [Physella acuta]XP_059142281.1 uncharacterized protein LOC131929916 [Physella acuta]
MARYQDESSRPLDEELGGRLNPSDGTEGGKVKIVKDDSEIISFVEDLRTNKSPSELVLTSHPIADDIIFKPVNNSSDAPLLGEGSCAKVIILKEEYTNERLALKIVDILHPDFNSNEVLCMYEIRGLSHFEVIAGILYISMPVIQGMDLGKARQILKKSKLPQRDFIQFGYYVLCQTLIVCRALREKKIIHCDLHSGNIMVNESMGIKIVDYGSCFYSEVADKFQEKAEQDLTIIMNTFFEFCFGSDFNFEEIKKSTLWKKKEYNMEQLKDMKVEERDEFQAIMHMVENTWKGEDEMTEAIKRLENQNFNKSIIQKLLLNHEDYKKYKEELKNEVVFASSTIASKELIICSRERRAVNSKQDLEELICRFEKIRDKEIPRGFIVNPYIISRNSVEFNIENYMAVSGAETWNLSSRSPVLIQAHSLQIESKEIKNFNGDELRFMYDYKKSEHVLTLYKVSHIANYVVIVKELKEGKTLAQIFVDGKFNNAIYLLCLHLLQFYNLTQNYIHGPIQAKTVFFDKSSKLFCVRDYSSVKKKGNSSFQDQVKQAQNFIFSIINLIYKGEKESKNENDDVTHYMEKLKIPDNGDVNVKKLVNLLKEAVKLDDKFPDVSEVVTFLESFKMELENVQEDLWNYFFSDNEDGSPNLGVSLR